MNSAYRADMLSSRKLSILLVSAALVIFVAPLAQAQLEITELMFNPNNEFVWEWIEVRNTSATAIDLDGYIGFNMRDAEPPALNPTIDGSLAANTSVGPGEVAVIYDGNQNGFMGFPSYDDAKFREAWGLGASVPLIAANFWPTLSNSTGSSGQSVAFWPNTTAFQADLTPTEDDPVNEPGVFTNRVTSFANAAFSIDYSEGFPAVDGDSSITWSGNGSQQAGSQWALSGIGQTGVTTSVEVRVPGTINNTSDVGNPGKFPSGSPASAGLHITEIMYDPASSEDNWEWIEVYNSSASSIDLAGWVVDDSNSVAHGSANIALGSVPAGEAAILFNDDDLDASEFKAAWGDSLNLIGVTNWGNMALNNGNDAIALWSNFTDYEGNHQFSSATGIGHANAVTKQAYDEDGDFPTLSQGPSISLADLSSDPSEGASWENSIEGDGAGSVAAKGVAGGGGTIVFHPGGDIASPGTFDEVTGGGLPGDYDDSGAVGQGDLDLVLLNWGSTAPPVPSGWVNQQPSGLIGQGDLDGVLLNWGNGTPPVVAAVPEPTSLVLLGLAAVCLPLARKQRNGRARLC